MLRLGRRTPRLLPLTRTTLAARRKREGSQGSRSPETGRKNLFLAGISSSTDAQDGQVLWSCRGAKCSPGNSSYVLASIIGGLPGQLRPQGLPARRLLELRRLSSNLWSCLTLRPARLSKPNNANISSTGRISGSSKAEQRPKCAPAGSCPPEVRVRGCGDELPGGGHPRSLLHPHLPLRPRPASMTKPDRKAPNQRPESSQ